MLPTPLSKYPKSFDTDKLPSTRIRIERKIRKTNKAVLINRDCNLHNESQAAEKEHPVLTWLGPQSKVLLGAQLQQSTRKSSPTRADQISG